MLENSALLKRVAHRDRAVRGELVHRCRQVLRQLSGHLLRRHTSLRCHLLHGVRTERLMNLIGRDGLICARADPGIHDAAQTLFLELLHDALNATVLVDEVADRAERCCADCTTEKPIE